MTLKEFFIPLGIIISNGIYLALRPFDILMAAYWRAWIPSAQFGDLVSVFDNKNIIV